MSTVYAGHHEGLNRDVAIKVLPDVLAEDESHRKRFHQEARLIARLRHPAIVDVYDFGERDGIPYIVSEYMPGGTLQERLRSPMEASQAIAILRPVASALDYAHSGGIIHRDLKPSNILLTDKGEPVLADFGLAKLLAQGTTVDPNGPVTEAGTIMGTPQYMSPEQCAGADPTPASDRYAFAVLAYHMLTGRVPFEGKTPLETILAHVNTAPPKATLHKPDLPQRVAAVLERGLAKDPAARPATASEFVDDLAEAASVSEVPAGPDTRVVSSALAASPVLALLAGLMLFFALRTPAANVLTHWLSTVYWAGATAALAAVVGACGYGFLRRRPWARNLSVNGQLTIFTIAALGVAVQSTARLFDAQTAISVSAPGVATALALLAFHLVALVGLRRQFVWGRPIAIMIFGIWALALVTIPGVLLAVDTLWHDLETQVVANARNGSRKPRVVSA
jgi:hypothetical protein